MINSYWQNLNQSIAITLKTGRIGRPVFVRCTATLGENPAKFKAILATLGHYVGLWFGTSASRLYALGSPDQTHITLTLEYPTGSSAILSLAQSQTQSFIDLTILGTIGAIYHQELIHPIRDGLLAPSTSAIQGQLGHSLLKAIEQGLETQGPLDLEKGG